jgi:hypothetical protein
MVERDDPDQIDKRRLMLSFYSSQLTTHARLIIGAVGFLFTILTITINLAPRTPLQDGLSFVGIWGASFLSWFLWMRDITYGNLANHLIHVTSTVENSLQDIRDYTSREARENPMFGIIPIQMFASIGEGGLFTTWRLTGLLLCGLFAMTTTIPLSALVKVWTFSFSVTLLAVLGSLLASAILLVVTYQRYECQQRGEA